MRTFSLVIYSVLITLAGCHSYRPATTPTPQPRTRIRVLLTDRGTADLAQLVGPGVGTIEGDVIADSGDTLVLAARTTIRRDGRDALWQGERVPVPRPLIATIQHRRFSRARTTLLAAGVVTVAVALQQIFSGGGFFGIGGGGGGGSKQ